MLRQLARYARALIRLRAYEPQPVTMRRLWRWLRQYPSRHRIALLDLLGHVQFVTKAESVQALQTLNAEVLGRLSADGVDIQHTVYVALDSAGSSSGVMLNLLRDHANLERRGARFIHSRDVTGLQELTRSLERGALIYVADFAGTGKQFLRNRRHAAAFLAGTFSEFFIGVCICDEAWQRMEDAGVVPVASIVHSRAKRPLHGAANLLSEAERAGLLALSRDAYPPNGLGFDELATSVVLYRNAPNTTPLLLRGNLGQRPLCGIVPRYDDM